MHLWIYKNNASNKNNQSAWGDWSEVFHRRDPQEWGRSGWFRSATARRIETEMAVGDRVVCHQTDRRSWVGIAVVDGLVPTQDEGTALKLRPVELFEPELKLSLIRRQFADFAKVGAFRQGYIDTIYDLSGTEELLIERVIQWAPKVNV